MLSNKSTRQTQLLHVKMKMKVGDIVRAGDSIGMIISIEYVKAGQYWVTCLWNDGCIEGCGAGDLEVINESR